MTGAAKPDGRLPPRLTAWKTWQVSGDLVAENHDDRFDGCLALWCASTFSWLCRIAGAGRAVESLPGVWARAVRCGADIDQEGLRTIAVSETREDVPRDDWSVTMRAIVHLVLVEGRHVGYVARVTGLSLEETAVAVDDALPAWRSTHPSESADDVLRRDEIWMDDDLVDACRRAIRCVGERRQGRTPTIVVNADAPRAVTTRVLTARRFVIGVALVGVAAGSVWAESSSTPSVSVNAALISIAARSTQSASSVASSLSRQNQHIEPGYMLDQLPAGYQLTSWEGPSNDGATGVSGWLQLWAETAQDNSNGRWFASVTSACTVAPIGLSPNSSRVSVDWDGAVTSESSNGTLHLTVGPTRTVSGVTNSVTLDAHGYSIDELRAIAAQFVLDTPTASCGSEAVVSPHKDYFAASVAGMDLLINRAIIGSSPQEALAPSDRR